MFVDDDDTRHWESVADDAWSWWRSVRVMWRENRRRYPIGDPLWRTTRDDLERASAMFEAKYNFARFRLELARVGLTVDDMWTALPE